ncbi:dihydrofolate reductase [Nosocomiicoccus ampullae]|nr:MULTISPECIES: dihydrofolate reductase [Nosocomiicoccus]MDK6862723.1 dihydrofolate reductase [Nosocomiicoccus ampullae]
MMLSLIVAYANQNVIGFKGDMPWRLPHDLKRLKEITTGHTIVMGRTTYESLGRPLPNRKNVVLTSQDIDDDGIEIIRSLDEIKSLDGKVFVFGGSKLYDAMIDEVEEMYVTEIYESFVGDTFFPEYDKNDFELISREDYSISEEVNYPYAYLHYVKKDSYE